MKTLAAFLLGAFLGATFPVLTKSIFEDAGNYAREKAPEFRETWEAGKEAAGEVHQELKEEAVRAGKEAIREAVKE